ncbi:MAG: polysaccharide biosynthesis protein [Thermacetogeniaceae bacterium]
MRLFLLLFDILAVNLAYLGALVLRFDGSVPARYLASYISVALPATALTLLSYHYWGLYRRVWRYASVREIIDIVEAVTIATLLVVAFGYIFVFHRGVVDPLPRSVYFIAWLLNVALTGGLRFGFRSARELRPSTEKGGDKGLGEELAHKRRALIVGAGDAGAIVARELKNHPSLGLEPIGFIDDDTRKHGLYLLGLPVLGRREDIPSIVRRHEVDEIIIAIPSAPGRAIREIVDICKETGARLKTLPGVYELIDGRVSISQIRDVQVEDLLGREPVQLNLEEIAAYLSGKVILVTGAGGSIGSELCRQIARFRPALLVLLDNSENNLFEIEQEIRERFPALRASAQLADIRDRERVEKIFKEYFPHVVFHAAAYKHVPMMERFPEHAVSNNIFGTYVVASAAERYGAEVFILISTDKAVHPVSVMGATKRAAELLIQQLDRENKARGGKTRYAAVRFGNVLGSRGSVIPIFKRQISQGGPVTVTHPEMERYFMTIPEAVQLIIQAGALAKGGEIFVLDMGEPVKIVDLARDLIRLSGLEPDEDIEIKFTGIRPGEKLREELFTEREKMTATRHSRILIARNSEDEEAAREVAFLVAKLESACLEEFRQDAFALIERLIGKRRGEELVADGRHFEGSFNCFEGGIYGGKAVAGNNIGQAPTAF